MAKVHDKYVVELAEIIKGYGNDPDINDPFCLSEFYRFYEVPNVCVSAENLKKMRPLSDYTEKIEPGPISEWKKEFREYVDSLDIARDDWKGIIEYINELPSVQSDDDRLERCRFEYINACKILAHRTPDTRKKDIDDAYAVVRALNPIFGEEGF